MKSSFLISYISNSTNLNIKAFNVNQNSSLLTNSEVLTSINIRGIAIHDQLVFGTDSKLNITKNTPLLLLAMEYHIPLGTYTFF